MKSMLDHDTDGATLTAPGADAVPSLAIGILHELEGVRRVIEERFSQAGTLLESSVDVVGKQIEALDRLTAAINESAVEATADDLLSTASQLIALPLSHGPRIDRLRRLLDLGEALSRQIDDMRTTLKYLRSFAFNVQITAAESPGIAATFQAFTGEMVELIRYGADELRLFDQQLESLKEQLDTAMGLEQSLDLQCRRVLPAVPDSLSADAAAIAAYHQKTAEAAAQVAALARAIQRKVGGALAALQIGDITRQRIEHVQAGLSLVDALPADDDAAARDRLTRRFLHMLADQMADISEDFHNASMRIAHNLNGLAGDSSEILRLQGSAAGGQAGGTDLRRLEVSVGQAVLLVRDVDAALSGADQLGRATSAAVESLNKRVGAIRTVRSDVQRMAINTTLRCGRLGDAGKPLNVIASELGNHASQLDASAVQTLETLRDLDVAAESLAEAFGTSASGSSGTGLDTVLNSASKRLRTAADVVERDLGDLTHQGAAMAQALDRMTEQLRIEQDLAGPLHAATERLLLAAGDPAAPDDDDSPVYDALMAGVFKTYTMARERTVHARHQREPAEAPVQVQAQAQSDEALFEDALF
jgi:hypothetical protein